ncbi:MAG: hypothetical protein IKU70_12290, partial [Clostridia bacterium]|nr:hypothetical protein [Clostridia bacterium]
GKDRVSELFRRPEKLRSKTPEFLFVSGKALFGSWDVLGFSVPKSMERRRSWFAYSFYGGHTIGKPGRRDGQG